MCKTFVCCCFLLITQSASADIASGNHALALAALAGEQSPLLNAMEKRALGRLLDGQTHFSFPTGKKITIRAKAIDCRASNLEIAYHACTLTFGAVMVTLKGRKAHEIFATIAEIGVPEDAAAGRVIEALSQLDCTIDPREIQQGTGGGAECSFTPGTPSP